MAGETEAPRRVDGGGEQPSVGKGIRLVHVTCVE